MRCADRCVKSAARLSFAPAEAYQFDWSHEVVVITGVMTTVKVAHMRLCHIASVSPETTVDKQLLDFNDPWDFEEVYGKLLDFARAYGGRVKLDSNRVERAIRPLAQPQESSVRRL